MDVGAFIINRIKQLGPQTIPGLILLARDYNVDEHEIRNAVQKLIFMDNVKLDNKMKLHFIPKSIVFEDSLTEEEQIILGED